MDNVQSIAVLPEKKNSGVDGTIRIKSGLRISVNEAGDEIFIPVENTQFVEDFYKMLDKFSELNRNIKNRTAGLKTADMVKPVEEEIRNMMEELDRLFGEGCCQKVFGNIVPSPYIIADFFNQMVPIFNQYAGERQARIAEKYGPNRQARRRNKKHRR